jgi:hypothetical protein
VVKIRQVVSIADGDHFGKTALDPFASFACHERLSESGHSAALDGCDWMHEVFPKVHKSYVDGPRLRRG